MPEGILVINKGRKEFFHVPVKTWYSNRENNSATFTLYGLLLATVTSIVERRQVRRTSTNTDESRPYLFPINYQDLSQHETLRIREGSANHKYLSNFAGRWKGDVITTVLSERMVDSVCSVYELSTYTDITNPLLWTVSRMNHLNEKILTDALYRVNGSENTTKVPTAPPRVVEKRIPEYREKMSQTMVTLPIETGNEPQQTAHNIHHDIGIPIIGE